MFAEDHLRHPERPTLAYPTMILANIFQPLIDIFGPVLVFFHSIIGGSWGWSIIALTVLVRALLLPPRSSGCTRCRSFSRSRRR